MNSDAIEDQVALASLAFIVTDTEEGEGGIVFAKSAEEAIKIGAQRYGDGDTEYFEARREPLADGYAGKNIPTSFLVTLGWRIECSGCGRVIDDDLLDERDLELGDIQGTQDTASYCSHTCEAADRLEQARAQEIEKRWERRMKAVISRRFPDAVFDPPSNGAKYCATALHRDDRLRLAGARVPFRLPFSKHGPMELTFRDERPLGQRFHYSCPNGDLEACRIYLTLHSDQE